MTLTDNNNKVWDVIEAGTERTVSGGVATTYLVRTTPANLTDAGASWLVWAFMMVGKKQDGTDVKRCFEQKNEAAAREMFEKNSK